MLCARPMKNHTTQLQNKLNLLPSYYAGQWLDGSDHPINANILVKQSRWEVVWRPSENPPRFPPPRQTPPEPIYTSVHI